ncbi:MAG: bifunctional uridylyltransferase/uridylyl-removing protein, partial [Phenylobacterium sp.]
LDRHKIELVAWLVEHHLVMSDYAQKRDVSDPDTVAAFARIVENPERLRLLLVLTVADIRAVGPGVWNGWKGQLMRELYAATETVFRGGRTSDAAGIARRRQEAIAYDARITLVAQNPAARDWATAMEDAYFVAFPPEEQKAHQALSERARRTGAAAEARVRVDRNAAEIAVAARDRQGLFADLALAISSLGGNVVGARIFTSRVGEALDVFYVQDASGQPFGGDTPRSLTRLTEAVEAAGRGEASSLEPRRAGDFGKAAAFAISPSVAIDNEASREATVIEASGRDRPGLLEALARTISEAELSILSAHIDGYGERAVDAFYVVTAEGEKLTDSRRGAAVRGRLTDVLEASETGPSRTRLPKARASAAR